MFKFSVEKDVCTDVVKLVRDCDFERTYLVGKKMVPNSKCITYIGEKKYLEDFLNSGCVGVICKPEFAQEVEAAFAGGILVSTNPKQTFFQIHESIGKKGFDGFETVVDESAEIDESAAIAKKGVRIGKNSVVMANAVIKEGTIIGDECIVMEGCVIGTPGYYYSGSESTKKLVYNIGGVKIGNNVTMHTNVVIETGVFVDTVIGDNTKLDNNVVVGHDVNVGKNCTIAGSTTLAGSVIVGDNCSLGVGVIVSPGKNIGDGASLSSGAVVTKDVPAGERYSGNFAIEHQKFLEHIKGMVK